MRTGALCQSQATFVEHLVRLFGTATRAHGSSIAGWIVFLFFEHDVGRVGGDEHGVAGLARGELGTSEGAGTAFFVRGFLVRGGGSGGSSGVGVGGNFGGGVLMLGGAGRRRREDRTGISGGGFRS